MRCLVRWRLFCLIGAAIGLSGFVRIDAAEPVLLDGYRVHPTRILAQLKPGRAVPAAQGGRLNPALRLAPRWIVVEEPPGPQAAVPQGAAQVDRLRQRLAGLKASGDFGLVEPDSYIELDALPSDAAFTDGRLWGLRNTGQDGGTAGIDINAVAAWTITTGDTNIIVAIIDTGVRSSHYDLATQMWRNPDELPGNGLDDDGNGYVDDVVGIDAIYGTGNPFDSVGHGTHVAGTVGASVDDGHPHAGVASKVRLMACRFIDTSGGYTSDAIECINYAVAHGARIVNASWGSSRFSLALFDTMSAARDAGVLIVAAAGNRGRDFDVLPNFPSGFDLENVISVAAIDRRGALATFSNFDSQRVHLGAPGVEIFSSHGWADDDYQVLQGTSMAAPHVSGVAALVWSRYPNLTASGVRRRLLAGVAPTVALTGNTSSGGRVDAYGALTVAEDGLLEVAASLVGEPRLLAGSTRTFLVQVSDLRSVTNAMVAAEVPGVGVVTFRNDGVPPDVRAGDDLYSATLIVPGDSMTTLTLNFSVVAPGFAPTNLTVGFPILTRPGNDDFAQRFPISGSSVTLAGGNQLATREPGEPLHAGLPGNRSVWWSWTAPGDGYAKIAQGSATFDYQIGIYTGATLESLVVALAHDPVAFTKASPLPVQAGETYHIAVDGFRDSDGDFTFVLSYSSAPPSGPANDFFTLRQPLSGLNPTSSGNNNGATRESMEPLHGGIGVRSLWWTWTAPEDARAAFDTANTEFGVVAVAYLGGAIYDLTPIGSAQSETNAGMPRLVFNAAAGRSYQFVVDSQTNGKGVIHVSIDAVPQLRPANDDFAARSLLPALPTTVTGTLAGATWEHRESQPASGLGSVWWRWQAEADGDVLAALVGSETEALVAVYQGDTPGSLQRVDFPFSPGRTGWHAMAGETYNIAVSGIETAEPAFALTLEHATAPVVLLPPRERTVFAGRTLRLVAETAGARPLFHQWLRDGQTLPDQTNATLVIAPATLDAGGTYTIQVSNFLGAASAAASITVQPLVPSVGVLNDPRFVDAGSSPLGGSEPAYLRAAVERVGYEATFVTDLERIGVAALVIPNQRNGSLARGLNPAARAVLVDFVRDGGLLLVTGSFQQRDAELIDSLFGLALAGTESTTVSKFYFRTPEADSTPFAQVPDSIESHAHTTLGVTSLPADAISLFQREDRALAALLPHGDGAIVHLGPLFLSVRPIGPIDGGWLALIEAALRIGGPPFDRAPIFEFVPESRFIPFGMSSTLIVSAYGSAPLSYQWYRGEEAVPLATNAVLALPPATAGLGGFYYAVASNAFGVTTSEVARVTVTPPDSQISVFDHPDFVRTGGGAASESDAVQASIRFLGHQVETVTNFASLSNLVVVIPSLAIGDLAAALDSDEVAALSNHVALGGALVMHGDALGHHVALLDRVFGWELGSARVDREGGLCRRQPLNRRSFPRYGPDFLVARENGGYYSLEPGTLPDGAAIAYLDPDDEAIVATISWGRGMVVHLGWNWLNAVPLGFMDDNWLAVLAATLEEGRASEMPPTLGIARLKGTAELQVIVRGTPMAPVEIQLSTDLHAWTSLGTNTIPASGVWRPPGWLDPASAPTFLRAREW
jgi:subtilisin family serine protease